MDKINLFMILGFKDQTYKYMDIVKRMNENFDNNIKTMEQTISWHYFMLSKYFNLYNFYENENKIDQYDNAIIYHLPFGKDNLDTGVEDILSKFKGRVPIVMRSYDPHSPLKTSVEYMDKYHDLVLTYISEHVNESNRLFANMSYDNHLAKVISKVPSKRKLACMILRRETREEYFEDSKKFRSKGLNLEKTYGLREHYVDFKEIDIYGPNWPLEMPNYRGVLQPHSKKYEVLNQHKFNFIIENAIVDNFISEKILDSFLSLCIPVYLGSPKVDEWIPKECYIDIRDFSNTDNLIDYLVKMSDKEYQFYVNNIKKYRKSLFEEFSTKNNFAIPVYKWYKSEHNSNLNYNEDEFDQVEQDLSSLDFKSAINTLKKLKILAKQIIFKLSKINVKLLNA